MNDHDESPKMGMSSKSLPSPSSSPFCAATNNGVYREPRCCCDNVMQTYSFLGPLSGCTGFHNIDEAEQSEETDVPPEEESYTFVQVERVSAGSQQR